MLQKIIRILLLLTTWQSDATHFRGGTVSWKHLGENAFQHQLEFNFRFGWRRDSDLVNFCDDDAIRNRTLGYAGGGWTVDGPSSVYASATTSIICTTYEPYENWAYGYNSFVANISYAGPFHLRYVGGNWISTLYQGGNGFWSVALSNINLETRSDTSQVNHPPTTFSPPIVRLLQGCPSSISISVSDDDNDIVTCRYAVSSPVDECADVCDVRYPHFALDQTTCTIHYDGGGGTYLIPMALMIEDHPRQNIFLGSQFVSTTDFLSQVPLQFIVNINTTTGCNVKPTYPSISIPENTTITIPESGDLDETLYAYPSAPNIAVTNFVVLGPVGVQTSAIVDLGNGLYATDITWEPDPDQVGNHKICYYAVDASGKNGEQRCFSVTVADIPNPCDVDNGGCSDICIPQGSRSTCACSLPCWSLVQDKKTCAPAMDVTCDGNGMDIYVTGCASNRTITAGTNIDYFTEETCQSSVESTRHHLKFGAGECGSVVEANPVQIEYVAQIWIWHGRETNSDVIIRGEWRNVPVVCSLSSTSTINGSFVPEFPLNDEFFPEDIAIEGMGTFSFFFEFYRDDSYTTVVPPTEYPLEVEVNDEMYISLGAVGQAGLMFFLEECVASASGATSQPSTLTYTFIQNGCALDETVKWHDTTSLMENRFSIQAFQFEDKLLSSKEDSEISLQCKVMLCDSEDNSTRCFQGCSPSSTRKKRSLYEGQEESLIVRSRLAKRIGPEENDNDDDGIPKPLISESPLQDVKSRFLFSYRENPTTTNGGRSGILRCTDWILLGIGVTLLQSWAITAWT